MIPLRLHIKNFLSYGSPLQTINFEPYHLICLSGKNGHGKSSLLDAMTWALWGQARKVPTAAKADEGLIRLGESDMMVALDFRANGASYRVRREYTLMRSKTGAQLDFGILDPSSGKLRALTGKTIRETQETINQAVGLDFAAFEHSAFLRQGNSAAFSRQAPQDRKETLAALLGLGTYEQLRKKATEKGRVAAQLQQQSAHTCTLLEQVVLQLPTLAEELQQSAQRYQELITQEEQLQSEQQRSQQQHQEATLQHHTCQRMLTELNHLVTRQQELEQKIKQWWQSRAAKGLSRNSVLRSTPLRGYEEINTDLMQLQQQAEARVTLLTEVNKLKEELTHATAEVVRVQQEQEQQLLLRMQKEEQALQLLTYEYQTTEKALQEAEQACTQLTLHYQAAEQIRLSIEELRATLKTTEQQQEKRQQQIQRLLHHQQRLVHELKQTHAFGGNQSTCTVCLQPISAEQQLFLQQHGELSLKRLLHQQKRVDRFLHQYQIDLVQLQKCILRLRQDLEQQTQREAQLALQHTHRVTYEQQLISYGARLQTLRTTQLQTEEHYRFQQATLTALQQKGATTAPCAMLQKRILKKEQELQAAATIQERYQQLQAELQQAVQYEKEKRTHWEEQVRHQEQRGQFAELCTQLRAVRKQQLPFRDLSAQALHWNNLLQESEEKLRSLLLKQKQLQETKEQIIRRKGACEQAHQHAQQQAVLLEKERILLKERENEATDYQLLAQALSKDGIQGMLIEQSLPEIEQEANALLAKLTDNQAQLRFESLRELKSGGMKETLDIKISDTLGIRPYELFSGGEAFRIDFALRLAISKLLARRAGASIQTLIIDEGFGSQDDEGLSHIMESLYAIQNEFAKIIIVSHLPSMKDQFPVHFHVHKGARGSVVHVLQQG